MTYLTINMQVLDFLILLPIGYLASATQPPMLDMQRFERMYDDNRKYICLQFKHNMWA